MLCLRGARRWAELQRAGQRAPLQRQVRGNTPSRLRRLQPLQSGLVREIWRVESIRIYRCPVNLLVERSWAVILRLTGPLSQLIVENLSMLS